MSSLPAWTKKMPKKVVICGRTYKIKYNQNRGGCADLDEQEIIIGCVRSKEVILEVLLHEISEIVLVELGYNFGHGREIRFVMDHAQFQNHGIMLTAALLDCGLLK